MIAARSWVRRQRYHAESATECKAPPAAIAARGALTRWSGRTRCGRSAAGSAGSRPAGRTRRWARSPSCGCAFHVGSAPSSIRTRTMRRMVPSMESSSGMVWPACVPGVRQSLGNPWTRDVDHVARDGRGVRSFPHGNVEQKRGDRYRMPADPRRRRQTHGCSRERNHRPLLLRGEAPARLRDHGGLVGQPGRVVRLLRLRVHRDLFRAVVLPEVGRDRAAAAGRRRLRDRLPDAPDRRLDVRQDRRPPRPQDLAGDLGGDDVRRLAADRDPADLRADRPRSRRCCCCSRAWCRACRWAANTAPRPPT